jgi:hypothetical protein
LPVPLYLLALLYSTTLLYVHAHILM